jgi:PhnB protein
MQSRLTPYVSFNGNAREAMEFYKSVFGGKLDLSTFGDTPMPNIPESEYDKIMHGMLEADNGMVLMGSDVPSVMPYDDGQRITLSLSGDDETELRGYWDKLADGGAVTMPLEQAPWGDSFGQLTDKYGLNWMVNISAQQK